MPDTAEQPPPIDADLIVAAPRCVCGHQLGAHEHYRDGSDCGLCGPVRCPAYRRARWWRRSRVAVDELAAEVERLTDERDTLRQHILDIDAHATPYGDIPDEPGWIGTYLVTAGALHRALGKIGHSAPRCQAEADYELLLQAVDAQQSLRRSAEEKVIATHLDLAAARRGLATVRAIAEEATDDLCRIGAYGIHDSRRDEMWANARQMRKALRDASEATDAAP